MQPNNLYKVKLGYLVSVIHLVTCKEMAILENLSTTTKTASLPLCVLGRATIKSMLTCSQGLCAMGRGLYSPLWNVVFALMEGSHLRMIFPIVPNIFWLVEVFS